MGIDLKHRTISTPVFYAPANIVSNWTGRLSIGPPLKLVWTLPFFSRTRYCFQYKHSNLPRGPFKLKNSMFVPFGDAQIEAPTKSGVGVGSDLLLYTSASSNLNPCQQPAPGFTKLSPSPALICINFAQLGYSDESYCFQPLQDIGFILNYAFHSFAAQSLPL